MTVRDTPSHRGSITLLSEAIENYRSERDGTLSRRVAGLLNRLESSLNAATAFARLAARDESKARPILNVCIEADDLARSFVERVERAKKTRERMLELFTPVVVLHTFVAELLDEQESPFAADPLSLETKMSAEELAMIWHGLELLASHIGKKGTNAKEELLKLGATRKVGIKQAGENAAIGWLALGVRRITGQPYYSSVRDLAEVILNSEVSDIERVRRCARVFLRKGPTREEVALVFKPSSDRRKLNDAIRLAKRRVQRQKRS